MKPYEIFIKFDNNEMVFKFKRDSVEECHKVLSDFKAKYPENQVSYKIIEKTVVENVGDIQ
jgi:hypothetical protein